VSGGPHRLRAYRPEDFDAVGAFWVESWAPVYPEIDFAARLPWLKVHLAELVARGVDVVVAVGDVAAPRGLLTIDRRDGDLDQLCVAAGEKGGGLAKLLLDEAKARSPLGITLTVNDRNVRAARFYAREGFAPIALGETAGRGISPAGFPTTKMRWRAAF
jgi:putative acetyltransferase